MTAEETTTVEWIYIGAAARREQDPARLARRALETLRRYHARLRSMRKQSAFRQYVDAEISRRPKDDR